MIGDKGKEIIANTSKNVRVARTKPVSLYSDYVHTLSVITRQPGAYMTNFEYYVKYTTNEVLTVIKRDKPFLVKIDLLDTVESGGHRFVDFEDFKNSEQFKEFIPFLLRYTSISEELFNVAKDSPSVDIPIHFDMIKYINDVKAKYKEQYGIELEHFTFFSTEEIEANNLFLLDKSICRDNSKQKRLKGVVDK